jgi:hypothetical protein
VFSRIISEHWGKCLTNFEAFKKFPMEEQESRLIVEVLLTSGAPPSKPDHTDSSKRGNNMPDDGKGKAKEGAASMHAAPVSEKRAALASDAHLKLLPGIIKHLTHFAQVELVVEKTNYESIKQRLEKAAPTSVTFYFVTITGKISAQQLEMILSKSSQMIKFIIRSSRSILTLLELTSNNHLVYRPESINNTMTLGMKVVAYSADKPVGTVVLHTVDLLENNPNMLRHPSVFWNDEYVQNKVESHAAWMHTVSDWVREPVSEDEPLSKCGSKFVLMIITPDHKRAVGYLRKHAGSSMHIAEMDAGPEGADKNNLRSVLDSVGNVQKGNQDTQVGDRDDATETQVHEVAVLCNSSHLPQSQLEALVARCCLRRIKLLLLITEATSDISRFRVFPDPRAWPIPIIAPIRVARLDASRSVEAQSKTNVVYTGLQLMFSPNAISSHRQRDMIDQYVGGSEKSPPSQRAGLTFLTDFEGVGRNCRFLPNLVSELADLSHSRSLATMLEKSQLTLAEILAMHINRYILFPKGDDFEAMVSFHEFCEQPLVRFLSQIHRVEAYIRFLSSRTHEEKQLLDPHSQEPVGVPVSRCFRCDWKTKFNNVHCGSGPGECMSALFITDPSVREASAGKVQKPEYSDPGRGDAVTNLQEILEHRAIKGDELNWEEMYTTWQSGPENLTQAALDHILIHSPSRISILLSLPHIQIIRQKLSPDALSSIADDFEVTKSLIRQMPLTTAGNKELRLRFAAIWWLLLTANKINVTDESFAVDQKLLLEKDVTVKPDEKKELLTNVAKALVQLDDAEALSRQQAVWEFVLNNDPENKTLVAKILDDGSITLGAAFISAACTTDALNAILHTHRKGDVIFHRLGPVFQWVKDSSAANAEKMRKSIEELQPRLTPKAVSTLLQRANHISRAGLSLAKDGFIIPCMQQRSKSSLAHGSDCRFENFFEKILEPLCGTGSERNVGLAVSLLEVLAHGVEFDPEGGGAAHDMPDVQDLANLGTVWQAMYAALQHPDDAATCQRLFKATEGMNDFVLPFESSDTLCGLYVCSLKKEGDHTGREPLIYIMDELDMHQSILGAGAARNAMFMYLQNSINTLGEGDTEPTRMSLLALLWFTWWSSPWKSVSSLPDPTTWPIFKAVLARVRQP